MKSFFPTSILTAVLTTLGITPFPASAAGEGMVWKQLNLRYRVIVHPGRWGVEQLRQASESYTTIKL